jgi:peptide deformylase
MKLMSRLTILEYPDPRLRTRARPVERFDEALGRLIDDMFETMYAAPGIGLAARTAPSRWCSSIPRSSSGTVR